MAEDVFLSEADISSIRFVKQSAPPDTPEAPSGLLYLADDDTLKIRDDSGVILAVSGGGSGAPVCQVHVTRTTDQAASPSVWTKLDFTANVVNTGQFDLGADRFTADVSAWHLAQVYGHVTGGANKMGCQLWKNGASLLERSALSLGAAPQHHLFHFLVYLTAGEYIEFYGIQTSAAAFTGDETYPQAVMIWRL